ncbi:UvrB/UvrC motif-containing protein, partial [Candidatus Sumerlaeota bacterium]|nr:UvrB/UvrC motif-containing protein [Candidatus Sumerlaeota bacterium]
EHIPEAKIEDLRTEMHKAVSAEDYERAAQIRDEIRRLEGHP